MKKILHMKWFSIPITVFLVLVLTAGAAIATGPFLTTEQTITQQINERPLDYGSISALDISLDDVEVGKTFTKTYLSSVIVDLGPDGAGKALRMVCNADSLYTSFDVTITLISKPVGSEVGLYGYGITAGGEVAIDLDVAGTYTFDQTLLVTAGSSTGDATSTVTFTLEDSTTPQ